MAFDKQLFKAVAPELKDTPGAILNILTPFVDRETREAIWGDIHELASAYLMGHMLTMAARKGRVGGVTSESVSSLSKSYGALSSINGALDLTSYGVEFKRLRRQLVTSPFLVC